MFTNRGNETPEISDEFLSALTSNELMDILSSKTVDLLAVLHQKNNRDYALTLKREVEKIQAVIRQRRNE